MRRRTAPLALTAALLAAPFAASCGDGGSPSEIDRIPRDLVVGVYTTETFTFDVQGSLPEKDLLAALHAEQIPELRLIIDGRAQLVYYEPNWAIERFNGRYNTLIDGVRVRFDDQAATRGLPLPRTTDLSLTGDGILVYAANVTMPLARLKELVPEFANEPFIDPVPGFMRVVFRRVSP